jgi:hypothetical protein
MAANGGGLRGFFRVVSEDIHAYRKELARRRRDAKIAARERREERRQRKRDKKDKKKKRRKSKNGRSSRRRDDDVDVELSENVSPDGYGEMA